MLQSSFHRSLALQLHAELLSIPSIRHSILEHLYLSLLPGTQGRDILGSWMVAALEEGRRASGSTVKLWEECTTWLSSSEELSGTDGQINLTAQLSSLAEYLSLSILDPPSLHDDIHPAPVSSSSSSVLAPKGKPAKSKLVPTEPEPVEVDDLAEERWARYTVAGLVGLAWLLQQLRSQGQPLPEELRTLIRTPYLWTALTPPMDEAEADSLGTKQPTVRRAAYSFLSVLVDSFPAELEHAETFLVISRALLGGCWKETEAAVWETAGPTIAKFLSSMSLQTISMLTYRTQTGLGCRVAACYPRQYRRRRQ